MQAAKELDKVLKTSDNTVIKALQRAVGFRIKGAEKTIDLDIKRFEFMLQV